MLGVNTKSKKEKHALIVGLAVGIFGGAFLPDKFNPVVLVKGLLHKNQF